MERKGEVAFERGIGEASDKKRVGLIEMVDIGFRNKNAT